ncbi:hypothetical protein AX16_004400 [Volvariella volvacea WC 439]|nr:hypothetical protein AX16_004400 [Volvariella volvacea WC 439]
MPDWNSPEEIQRNAFAFVNFIHVLFGLYIYEWFISLNFDWDFIKGERRFRWPMIFYFANRYLLLFAMIGIIIGLDTETEVNCQPLFTFNQIAGDAAVGLASINLSVRTMAVWSYNRWVIGGLTLIILGHWTLILKGVLLKAEWVPGQGCVIIETDTTVLAAIFIYSMCLDFIVLMLSAFKLLGLDSKDGGPRLASSVVGNMVFRDGLIFFLIAFLANMIATIFMLMNLNPIMSIIFNVPAAVFSTIVACRAVRRLTNFTHNAKLTTAPTQTGDVRFNSTQTHGRTTFRQGIKSEVHVQMETFSRSEDPTEQDINYASNDPKIPIQTEAPKKQRTLHFKQRDGSDPSFDDAEAKGQAL